MDPDKVLELLYGASPLAGLFGGGGDVKVNTNTNVGNNISLSLSNTTGAGGASSGTGSQSTPSSQSSGAGDDIPPMPSAHYGYDLSPDPRSALGTLDGAAGTTAGAAAGGSKTALALAALVVGVGALWWFKGR